MAYRKANLFTRVHPPAPQPAMLHDPLPLASLPGTPFGFTGRCSILSSPRSDFQRSIVLDVLPRSSATLRFLGRPRKSRRSCVFPPAPRRSRSGGRDRAVPDRARRQERPTPPSTAPTAEFYSTSGSLTLDDTTRRAAQRSACQAPALRTPP